jgi:hypothetical protein
MIALPTRARILVVTLRHLSDVLPTRPPKKPDAAPKNSRMSRCSCSSPEIASFA